MVRKTEEELIREFLKGDEKAFNLLLSKYLKSIYWHARRMVGNHEDADDVAQEVIITIYKKIHTFNFDSLLKTWIYKITQTRSLNLLRKRKIRKFLSIQNEEVRMVKFENDIVTHLEDKEKLDKIEQILNRLPIKQKQVFIMRHYDNLSYEEISEITGKSVGGLKANYHHASKKIFGFINE